jgi:hypothetical protein
MVVGGEMKTMEKTWMVRANSFSRPDYEISGSSLREAVVDNLARILKDVAPWAGERDVLAIDMRWQDDILGGAGGAEVELTVAIDGNATHFVVWIGASREEVPNHVFFKRSGDRFLVWV